MCVCVCVCIYVYISIHTKVGTWSTHGSPSCASSASERPASSSWSGSRFDARETQKAFRIWGRKTENISFFVFGVSTARRACRAA